MGILSSGTGSSALSCVLEVSVSVHLGIPILTSSSDLPPPEHTHPSPTEKGRTEDQSPDTQATWNVFFFQLLSCYLAVLQFYCVLACNCVMSQEQSTLGFYFCEFVVAVYLFWGTRSLYIELSGNSLYRPDWLRTQTATSRVQGILKMYATMPSYPLCFLRQGGLLMSWECPFQHNCLVSESQESTSLCLSSAGLPRASYTWTFEVC